MAGNFKDKHWDENILFRIITSIIKNIVPTYLVKSESLLKRAYQDNYDSNVDDEILFDPYSNK